MKKYIILSVNDNPDYLYFTPLTCWAWRQFGWEPIVFYHKNYKETQTDEDYAWYPQLRAIEKMELMAFNEIADLDIKLDISKKVISNIPSYRSDTITQISRLYGSALVQDGYVMTCDIDMIPLSDYWKPDETKFTVWGHDLTGFKNFPLCYIGAPAHLWREVMQFPVKWDEDHYDYNTLIKRDLDSLPQAKSTDWYQFWETDQDHITARLKAYGTDKINFINRGQGKHGFARGRVDKGQGGWVFDQPELIDAHLLQQAHHSDEKIRKLMDLLHHVWPAENWKWFLEYTKEFKKLAL